MRIGCKYLLCLLGIALFPSLLYGKNSQLDSLLTILDREIDAYPQREQKKIESLDSLRREYNRIDEDSVEKYFMGERLIQGYYYFSADSTRSYMDRNIKWAWAHHKDRWVIENKVRLGWYYACMGMYVESEAQLQEVDFSKIPDDYKEVYYGAKRKLFKEMGAETRDAQLKDGCARLCLAYTDSLQMVKRSATRDYYWYTRIDSLFKAGDRQMCLHHLNSYSNSERTYALIAYIIGTKYEEAGEIEEAMCYYVRAATADIRSNTKDHGALPLVSEWLFEQGDIERAYHYITFSWRQYNGFGSKLRYVSNLPLLSLAEEAYKKVILARQHTLMIYTISISVLVLFLLVSLVFIFLQLKRISKVRNDLNSSNKLLSQYNEEIKDVNERLQESNEKLRQANTIKEKYLAYFIQQCFVYINDMDEYRRRIKKAIMRGDTQEALDLAASGNEFEKKLNDLYATFDRTFLDIFPDFVTSFNRMLQDDKQIVCKENELLTTEIRIYALIKLGVTDYKDIARFLRCSINTIYNYRAKINSRLKVSKEEFSAFMKG